jgi:multidrug efflux pump subunit AcrA (membrane-fusion protein)
MAAKRVTQIVRGVMAALVLTAVVGAGYWFFFIRPAAATGDLTASGTVEATEVNLGTQLGGRVEAVLVKEGDKIQRDQILAKIQPGASAGALANTTEMLRAPIDGVVLLRLFEPSEIATPGSTVLVLGNLYDLNLTVYVPEDRYGEIVLGQAYPVTVDSFPGRVYSGTVSHIADQAEFTPRNVQTVEGRKTTVFAIRLSLANPDLALKPGMPADVNFSQK